MSITGDESNQRGEPDRSRRTIFVIAGLVALLLVGGLVAFLKTRPEPAPPGAPVDQRLDGGIRAGSPEFDKYRELIKMDAPIAEYSGSVAGDVQLNLGTTVRNFTGQTITGLEMRGALNDFEGKPIKQRIKIVIPSGSLTELENNGTAKVPIALPGFRGDDKMKIETGQGVVVMEVTAVKFK